MAEGGNESQVQGMAQRNCASCSKPDTHDDMVACDSCDSWHHYSCVKVDERVKDRKWNCPSCELRAKQGAENVSSDTGNKAPESKGAKPKVPELKSVKSKAPTIPTETLTLRVKKLTAKSTTGSKVTRKSKVNAGEPSITSSARARLEQELKVLNEQQRVQEEELAVEKQMKDLQLKQETELREMELAYEAKKIADAKVLMEKKVACEVEFRRKQMAIRKQSAEEKAKLIRQASEYGSSRASVGVSETDSREKVVDWLEKSNQQIEGTNQGSTLAIDPVPVVFPNPITNNQVMSKNTVTLPPVNVNVIPAGRNPSLRAASRSLASNNAVHETNVHTEDNRNPESSGNHSNSRQTEQRNTMGNPNPQDVFCDVVGPQESVAGSVQGQIDVNCTNNPTVNQHRTNYDGPTSRQLATRQVMGKDLPIFAGNPEEWPIWISNFERSTSTCGFSLDENLIRLQRCLKGPALEAVRSRLLCPASVPHVIRTLEMRYGRPETLIRAMTERIKKLPPPRVNDLDSIIEFGLVVDNLVEHIKNSGQHNHLSNPSLLYDLVGKLPVDYRLKWSAYKSSLHNVNLGSFGEFMATLVELAYDVADDFPTMKQNKTQRQKTKERVLVQTHSETSYVKKESNSGASGLRNSKKPCVVCKVEGHRVVDCCRFKAMNIDERMKVVNQNGMCRSCLNQHGKWPCKTAKECAINDCRQKHHTLLHAPNAVQAAISSSHLKDPRTGPLFRIIPVTLYGNNCQVDIYAFVDEGSQITLLEDAVAKQLGLNGTSEPLSLQWTGNIKRSEPKSYRVNTEISGVRMSKRFKLVDARTVGGLLLPSQTMNYQELSGWYPHLRGIPLQNFEEVSPKLLIGLDNLKLTVPLKIREGGWEDPIAAKSRIGWSVYGSSTKPLSMTICGFHVGGWTDPEQELNQLVRDYITLDNTGVTSPSTLLESEEDKRARLLLESTTRRIEGGFETGLLWRWDEVRFPNSYGMAYKRLRSLEKRLSKDPDIYERVRQLIREYEEKGYAHKATQHELSTTSHDQCWYLPLGIVINPKKPKKLRMIWDAAATVDGVSLNSTLLKGPDYLTSLPTVVSKFRLYRFALTGDIKEMFHRFFIREQDRQCQRFLFRDHPDQDPIVYVMNVAIFGATCSPSCAQYIKNLNAKEFEAECPRAVAAIVHHHYVDDYLDSFGSVEEAVKIGCEVKTIHLEGGFEIRNFLSNDTRIAALIGAESADADKDIRTEKGEQIESVLGMKWITSSDSFTYTVNLPENLKYVLEESHIPTKREILRTVMSFFDPMGLIAYFLIHGRILMQDIWATGIGWDDRINDKLWMQWRKWVELIPKLNTLRIPRCYFSDAVVESYSSLQVHAFVDASKSAYACAVYFRVDTPNGPAITLVAAKSKVSPLKMLTIPRLELQAAVLGSRFLNSIISMHAIPVTKRFLWTDSATVLAWIRSDQRRYHQFVGFRTGEILSTTDVGEWRKVPSRLNVSDDATKWGSGPNISSDSRWFQGPDFLLLSEELWPGNNEIIEPTEEEMVFCNVHQSIKLPLVDVSRFSRWERLHRTVAYVHRVFCNYHRHKRDEMPEEGPLTKEELKKAEITLWRQAQEEFFISEITVLKDTKGDPEKLHGSIAKSCPIFKLWSFMDENGVLRKRSRLGNAEWISYGTKYPVILPRQHRITFILVDAFHRRFRLSNRETVVNELRQLYEIPNLRSIVAEVSRNCMWCKVYNAHPRAPPMAPLPKIRLTPYVRPFTYVGLDYFGPVLAKVGRSNAKRWIALFTCLTIRAVHLEVVHSLSTQSCVMAVRRFVSRRGSPAEIFSDNAMNFHGANNLLENEIKERNERLATVFTNSETRWSFIPPSAPHMGGAWERMVKSVKAALGTILDAERRPDDEVLETVIVEAEAMVNTRPLTYIPLESANQEALTPNHFLLGSSSGVKQLSAMPVDPRATLRSGWKLAQHLSDGIWRRWIKEYLPVISRRSKWFDEVKNIAEGDLVLIVEGTIRNQWIRGKVDKVVRGKDGRVRQAWVQTSKGVIRRPVVKLALLDVVNEGKPETDGLRAGECDVEYPSATTVEQLWESPQHSASEASLSHLRNVIE
ncbi:uncharacterized protein LOC129779730 [Toxorhynchites rutilus septentrionalis]|uniref:uncharacterized protein LOC129779730 n=1 Tax=Toxorhynchites rutilus septentrionalis TaxID=329112 RepID=UPI00247AA2AB|nr:uncharacterized protein LOC129779730 [Toxorhynchites rutilus septentrionalis]